MVRFLILNSRSAQSTHRLSQNVSDRLLSKNTNRKIKNLKRLKILVYLLAVLLTVKIGIFYLLGKLSDTLAEIEFRYTEIQNEISRVTTFKDSLIYNSDFRLKVLGSSITKAKMDSAIQQNRRDADKAIEKAEILLVDRNRLERNFRIYRVADQLLILLCVVTGGSTIYFWIKNSG